MMTEWFQHKRRNILKEVQFVGNNPETSKLYVGLSASEMQMENSGTADTLISVVTDP